MRDRRPNIADKTPTVDPVRNSHPVVAPVRQHFPWTKIFLNLWGLGVLTLSVISLAGILRVQRILRRCRVGDHSEIVALRAALATSPNLHPRLRWLISSDVRVPLVAGWWRPAIVMPESALPWTPTMLRAALVHEMAHIERNDVLTAAFARVVLSCFWFHPAAWLAWKSLRAQAEMAADDRVVLAETDPTAYAEGLLFLARSLRANHGVLFPAIGMLRDSGLPARVERILSPDRPRIAPARKVRWAVLFSAAIVSTASLTLRPVAGLAPAALAEEPKAAPSLTLPPLEILIDAIAQNDLAKATSAVNAGADPNAEITYSHGSGRYVAHNSAFYFAVDLGRLPILKLLLEHGAQVKPKTKGWSPMDVALHSGFSDVVKYLHEHGANCDPLVYAGAIGDVDTVKQLLPPASAKAVADATIAAAGCNQLAAGEETGSGEIEPVGGDGVDNSGGPVAQAARCRQNAKS